MFCDLIAIIRDFNPVLPTVNMENQALGEAYRQESTV